MQISAGVRVGRREAALSCEQVTVVDRRRRRRRAEVSVPIASSCG